MPIYLNGRFLVQPLSGVQRFATEMMMALDRVWGDDLPRPEILVPGLPSSFTPTSMRVREIKGRPSGQLWEQLALPRHVSNGILVNLGNTAPLRAKRQLVVIHDAGVFARPEAYSPSFRLWYKVLHRALVRSRTHIVTVSEFSKRELVRYLGANGDAIDVLPEGADHMLRITGEPSVLTRHNLLPGKYVLAVGNLSAHKNLSALSAMAEMLEQRNVDLVITGGLNSTVFNTITAALPQPARYIGRVSDAELRTLYENASCFVFPSTYEGFGLPAIEAMACGCPVVAASIPALHEVCGEAALYFDPYSPPDIATQISRLLDNDSLAEGLRSAGALRARSFNWDSAARALCEILSHMEGFDHKGASPIQVGGRRPAPRSSLKRRYPLPFISPDVA